MNSSSTDAELLACDDVPRTSLSDDMSPSLLALGAGLRCPASALRSLAEGLSSCSMPRRHKMVAQHKRGQIALVL